MGCGHDEHSALSTSAKAYVPPVMVKIPTVEEFTPPMVTNRADTLITGLVGSLAVMVAPAATASSVRLFVVIIKFSVQVPET